MTGSSRPTYVTRYDALCSFDYITITVTLFIIAVNTCIIGLLIKFNKWPPLRAKQPFLLCISYIGGTIFMLFSLQSNGITDQIIQTKSWQAHCNVLRYMGQMVFGFCLWASCILVRMIRLFIILKKGKLPWSAPNLLLIIHIPSMILAIIGIAMKSVRYKQYIILQDSKTFLVKQRDRTYDMEEDALFDTCGLQRPWQWILTAYFLLFYVVFVVLTIKLRKIRKSFNENTETYLLTILGICVTAVAAFFAARREVMTCVGRNALTLALVVIVSTPLWIIVAPTIYDKIFHEPECAKSFRDKLRSESVDAVQSKMNRAINREIDPSPTSSQISSESSPSILSTQYIGDGQSNGATSPSESGLRRWSAAPSFSSTKSTLLQSRCCQINDINTDNDCHSPTKIGSAVCKDSRRSSWFTCRSIAPEQRRGSIIPSVLEARRPSYLEGVDVQLGFCIDLVKEGAEKEFLRPDFEPHTQLSAVVPYPTASANSNLSSSSSNTSSLKDYHESELEDTFDQEHG